MLGELGARVNLGSALDPAKLFLGKPVRLLDSYERSNLRPDLVAGLTVAVILLPQAIAFAIIADLPPRMGLYTAVVGAVFAGLWGSSNHVHTGPANLISLLVLSTLQGAHLGRPEEFMIAAGLMAVMVGVFQLLMGLARLGVLINFVSHSVVVGFSTGAGALIAIKQVGPLLGFAAVEGDVLDTAWGIVTTLPDTHLQTALLGAATIFSIALLRRVNRKLPGALIGMVVASFAVFAGQLDESGVVVIGRLPGGFPPLAKLPLLDMELMGRLSVGSLAIGAIGLVETMAIARSLAAQTGQRLDSNQEFVGQGLANIASGLFSGFPAAASFSRSAVNYAAGARTPMASVFSSAFVMIALLALGPLAAFLPATALAGVLIVTSYHMVDREEIRRIWRGARGDAAIMLVTFLGTLFLSIEFAVLTGILFSFARYIMRTSAPKVQTVVPDSSYRHFIQQPGMAQCPQLNVVDILGDLYFGAVNHIEETLMRLAEEHPEQRYLLIRMHSVNHCDFSGIHMLETVVRSYRDRGGDVFVVRACSAVRKVMLSTGFDAYLEGDHFLSDDDAISHLFYRVLDPAICIYECPVRVFKECQNLPKREEIISIPSLSEVPVARVISTTPQELWQRLHESGKNGRPFIVDVREPREFRQGHIPEAQSVPLPQILQDSAKLPSDRQTVLVCRSGRRSLRAAYALQQIGCMNVVILQGGMLSWEAAGLLEAIDQ
jgi:SulP family sulfate permease